MRRQRAFFHTQLTRPAATLRCAYRTFGDAAVTAAELRAALRTLNLRDDCTEAEVKRAFQAFAILHHPDMNVAAASSSSLSDGSAAAVADTDEGSGAASSTTKTSSTPPSAAAAATAADASRRTAAESAEMMHRGTEAYHLLRQVPFEVRQRILREGRHGGSSGGDGRFRGPFRDFQFTEEEYAKAQRVYQGDRNRRRQRRRNGSSGEDGDDTDDFFDLRTEEGRRRAARFQEVTSHIAEMRRRGRRDDLPPWRVRDGADSTAAAFNAASSSSSSSSTASGASAGQKQGRARQRRGGNGKEGEGGSRPRQSHSPGTGPRNPNRLGLHFFNSAVSNLNNVRDLYRSRPGFAGMDGSSYDNPNSASRVAAELAANPHLRQYILMKHRAQEKAIVDRAVRQPLLLFLILVCGIVLVLTGVKVARSSSARARQDEAIRERDEERGGA
ncbi:hypothetical protein ABB37_09286 [Leptomonas pyrrhocoris]|uniref:J domain-containing protein n=1 Tax=Leptomonas pyrrhocoris TaxID=157538 RepID=A0A0M9FR01_LEPPY|nr:hypothetical protein ABB37_09286 [Leptomonas pyrrhocoris]XP_015652729.1 hypothetical protein ABB37_09286 [Leptomonas pyrrhocoris]KPA74289.1 hypothetical protein ABB37_09286 [Leptomonas pyrrhocoris]KPA74290.1 hypothetical protein ABB37_09286 [Leptomonas pyrrhocoris]|eukprot:XP_015652728.1 hypothetical protein ABB37_09286 [Leptomonas pyrrhocoris]